MAEVLDFDDGGYRFIRGVAPYSAGVVAARGFQIERVRFHSPVAIDEGFRRIRIHLKCSFEVRDRDSSASPTPCSASASTRSSPWA